MATLERGSHFNFVYYASFLNGGLAEYKLNKHKYLLLHLAGIETITKGFGSGDVLPIKRAIGI
jgi:hypothetical protein